ncbi:MAG: 2-amino-4-hydroxy-6-hydroxymethyldihydropteridine diphosphokinase [Desulfuromonadaceae bacterium]
MTMAYLALGSNLGDRLATLRGARAALEAHSNIRVTGASSIYETEAVGGPTGQDRYFNAVLQVETGLAPRELLTACHAIEQHFGRRREVHWGPRTLDIDLLFFGEASADGPDLMLPHPHLHLRRFVLAPLLELAPALIHPRLGKSIRELYAHLNDPAGLRRAEVFW